MLDQVQVVEVYTLCGKQGRIDRPDVPRTANPRPLAVPCPGGAGRDRTGEPGLGGCSFLLPPSRHVLAKLGRHGRTNFSMSRLRSAGSPARSCCRGGKAVSLLSKGDPRSLRLSAASGSKVHPMPQYKPLTCPGTLNRHMTRKQIVRGEKGRGVKDGTTGQLAVPWRPSASAGRTRWPNSEIRCF